MKRLFFFFLLSFFTFRLFSQTAEAMDTVYLMSGRTVTGVVKDSSDEQLKILVLKKGNFKADFIDIDLVYSVKYKNGVETVFYRQDTLFGNYYTAQEVRYFLQGERDAIRSYRCPVWSAGAFAFGFAGGLYGGFVAPFLTPFAYAGTTTFFRIKIKPGTVSNPSYLKYDTYLLGYEKEARKRRIFRALIWGGIGMIGGLTTNAIINNSN
ncbi:MAG: hypothetical protein M3R17_13250 [Bacteroidota bacterium]|nr:hypothetical protein [Bacteroidota bacterium]